MKKKSWLAFGPASSNSNDARRMPTPLSSHYDAAGSSSDSRDGVQIKFWSINWEKRRHRMVRRDLASRGVVDRQVLAAMASVPREKFVPAPLRARAYADLPLPIGSGQTISQPYIVAVMTLATGVNRKSRVLEIGTGSGYHTAVLAQLAAHVWSVERIKPLHGAAAKRLEELGITNVSLVHGDGALGYPDAAPYDAIVVAAAAPTAPPCLLEQLAAGGKLVIPVGDRHSQELTVYERVDGGFEQHAVGGCRFVPLVSPHAFRG